MNKLNTTRPLTVLLVDDDDDERVLFVEALDELNRNIVCDFADNGEAALKVLTDEDDLPDYIFLDLNMHLLNGMQCLAKIKSHGRLKNIPIIIYTTSRLEKDRLETQKLGASYFLSKPKKFDNLVKALTFIITHDDKLLTEKLQKILQLL
jgi:CheY-like chemotaxis protein